MSPHLLAEVIRHNKFYKGQEVRLLSCSTGQVGANGLCFAQKLANAMGINVYAPTEIVNIDENGEVFVSDNDILAEIWYNADDRSKIKETGKWILFRPQKE